MNDTPTPKTDEETGIKLLQLERIRQLERELAQAQAEAAAMRLALEGFRDFCKNEGTPCRVADTALSTTAGAELLAERDALRSEVASLKAALAKQHHEITQTLGKALGYPLFKDDQKNFPNATEADGVCVGDHVAESIATEAARKIEGLKSEVERLREDKAIVDWLSLQVVQVRVPMRWGSREMFIASPDDGDCEQLPSNLRKLANAARKEQP